MQRICGQKVEVEERVTICVNGKAVLTQQDDGRWRHGYDSYNRAEWENIRIALQALSEIDPLELAPAKDEEDSQA